jgi:cysteine-rich repeat protein
VTLAAEIGPGKEGTVCDSSSVVGGDAELTLYNSAGIQLGNDDDGGVDYCSLLTIGLFPGTYYLEVRASDISADDSVVFDYSLNIETTPVVCGNGDVVSPEACDDGNTTPGDGCSTSCTFEPGWGCSGEPSVCVNVPAASCGDPIVVADGFNFVAADITVYGDDLIGFPASCINNGVGRADLVFRADLAAGETVNVVDFGSADLIFKVLAGGVCGGTTACASAVDLNETTTGASYTATAAGSVYIVVETVSATPGSKAIDLDFVINPCGDGVLDAGQTCDDGNNASGDGCAATCTIETGYLCTGAPSVCTPLPDASCADPILVSNGFSYVVSDITAFDDELSGFDTTAPGSCVTEGGGRADIIFRADLTAGQTIKVNDFVSATDLVIKILNGGMCADGLSCAVAIDGGEDTTGAVYTATAAETVYIVVEPYSAAPSSKAVDLEFAITTCGNGVLEGTETCDDGNLAAGDGCSSVCAVEAGFACAGQPSSCAAPAASTCAAPIVATDGFRFVGNTMAGFGDELNGFPTSGAGSCITEGGGGRPDIVFSVALAGGQTVNVKDFGSIDVVFKVLGTTCASGTACLASFDGGNSSEESTGVNYTATVAETIYVVVESYSANPGAASTYDIRFDLTP